MGITKKLALPSILLTGVILMSGCGVIKPFDKPEFVEIEPNQTAFVIPLEGKTSNQDKFESESFLQDAQVATKRIEIPHKWVKTGKMRGSGKYMDTIRVIVVDRFPATREWKDESTFVGESMDSIKFNQGMSATAQILEEDAATFLYQYAGKKLDEVMGTEIRNKIGSVLLEEYSKKTIEEIRADKGAILSAVRSNVEPYFKERGITLSNIGYIGDLKYIDPKIQEAINKKFNAQEEQKAQTITNSTNEQQATSELKQAKTRQSAMDTLKEMRELELQAQWIEKWSGNLPMYMGGDSSNILNLPELNTSKKE